MKKYTEKARDYFERHQRNECFITSDGRVFHDAGSAQGFAGTLENNEVESYQRKEVINAKAQNQETEEKGAEKNKVDDIPNEVPEESTDERAEKLRELENLELVPDNRKEMEGLAKYFELQLEDKKVDTLISALTEFKSKIKD